MANIAWQIPLSVGRPRQERRPRDINLPDVQGMRLKELGIQREEARREKEQKLSELAKRHTTTTPEGGVTVDRRGMLNEMYQVDPMLAMKTEAQVDRMSRDEQREHLRQAKDTLELQSELLKSAKDEPSYQQALERAQALQIPLDGVPPNYDAQWVARATKETMSAKDVLDQIWKQKNFDQKERFHKDNLAAKKEATQGVKPQKAINEITRLQKMRQAALDGEDLSPAMAFLAGRDPEGAKKLKEAMASGDAVAEQQAKEQLIGAIDAAIDYYADYAPQRFLQRAGLAQLPTLPQQGEAQEQDPRRAAIAQVAEELGVDPLTLQPGTPEYVAFVARVRALRGQQ